MKTFVNMLRDESGAAAAEYALILAIVGGAIAFAAVQLGNAVSNSMTNATNCINSPPSSATSGCTAATPAS
jgi:pilus assembly protein Flp/PilA